MGRLFDAVAALAGVRGVIQYEAQAAIDLETLAARHPEERGRYPFEIAEEREGRVIRIGVLIEAVTDDIRRGVPAGVIAARFHNGVIVLVISLCKLIARETGLRAAALSGGVFQNHLLTGRTAAGLEDTGLTVYTHRQVPCNDGGLSLGQAAIAGFSRVEEH